MGNLNKLKKIFSEDIGKDETVISSGKCYRTTNSYDYLLTSKALYSTMGYKIFLDNLNGLNWGSTLNGMEGRRANLKKNKRKYDLSIDFPPNNIQQFVSGKTDGGWYHIISGKKFIDDVINAIKKNNL